MIQTMTLPNGKVAEAMFYAGSKRRTHGIAVMDPETGEWTFGGMYTSRAVAQRFINRAEQFVGPAERVIVPVNA